MRKISARDFRGAMAVLTEPVETRDGIFVPKTAPIYQPVRGVIEGELAVVGWDAGAPGGDRAVVTGTVPSLPAEAIRRGSRVELKAVPAQPLPAEARVADPPFSIPATRPAPKPSQRKRT